MNDDTATTRVHYAGRGWFEVFSPVLWVKPWQHVTAIRDPQTGIFYDWQVVDDDLNCDDGLEDGR